MTFEVGDFAYGFEYTETLTPLRDIGKHTIYISNTTYEDIKIRREKGIVDIYVKDILIYTDKVNNPKDTLDYSFSNNALRIWII